MSSLTIEHNNIGY